CARELGAIVADDGIDLSSFGDEPVEYARYPSSGQREIHLGSQALPGEIVDEGQDSEATSICQGVRHEVHRPALVRTAWWRWNASKRGRDSLPLLPTDDEVLARGHQATSPGGTSDRPSCGLPGSLAAEAEHGAVGTRTEGARTQSGEVLGGVPSVPPSEVRTGTTTDRGRSLGRRAARKLRMFGKDSPQPGAQRRALPFFLDDRLEHLDVESLVGNELLEPPILLFELLQPLRL